MPVVYARPLFGVHWLGIQRKMNDLRLSFKTSPVKCGDSTCTLLIAFPESFSSVPCPARTFFTVFFGGVYQYPSYASHRDEGG